MNRPKTPEGLFLFALCAISFLAELGFVIVNISNLPLFLEHGLQLPNLPGIALATYYLIEALANSPMGTLADRLGRRRLMVLGTCVSILTCLATSQLRNPGGAMAWGVVALVLLLRALDGLGAAALWPNVYAAVGDRVSPARQARANTFITMAYMASIPLAVKVGGWMNKTLGASHTPEDPLHYLPAFFFAAGCFAATSLLSYFVAPRKVEQHHITEAEAEHAPGAGVSLVGLKTALKTCPWLLGLIFLIFISIGLIAPYMQSYFIQRFHIDEDDFGNLMLGPAVLIGLAATPLGHLSDTWGKTRTIRLGTALCAVALWGILFSPIPTMLIVLGTLLGVGFVMAFPAYMAFVASLAPEAERGGMIGAARMAQGVGAMLGSVLSSPLYTVDTHHHFIFYLAASILTLGFLLSLIVVKEPEAKVSSVVPSGTP
ncbi:MAG: MFS transporter [Armatimonas sp.]